MSERGSLVRLYDGREVSSYSEAWRAECYERHAECLRLEALVDKEARYARLAIYRGEVVARAGAAGLPEPDSVGAEAERRVRELVLERWRARMAARAAA